MGQSQFKMDGYIDVAERIRLFHEQYPEGTLQQVHLQLAEFAGGMWVIYTAAAYRTPDDVRPGMGTAWEPVPGRTPFTKDSEVQNAETAAWGRAIVALGSVGARIASADEIQNREADRAAVAANPTWEAMNEVKREISALMPGAGPGAIIAYVKEQVGKDQDDWTLADLVTVRDALAEKVEPA